MSDDIQGVRIHISGIVQGVGFRPFVYGLAKKLDLKGWVRNSSSGVDIEIEGCNEVIDTFIELISNHYPPLGRIDQITVEQIPANGFKKFEIIHSISVEGAFQPISPDVSICPDCLQELFDPSDRRYLYPFINCTNCGPRFSIIDDIPYDRPNTTMASFRLCSDCTLEYHDPGDRRFHAQPVACPDCGPQVWLEFNDEIDFDQSNQEEKPQLSYSRPHIYHRGDAIRVAQSLLLDGRIVAIKGLGGFHLACDATNDRAVEELRRRKLRADKPFALMMPDLATIESHCWINDLEKDLLASRERPIVVLRRRADSPIAKAVAPNQATLGVMLPYTPLHYLLFSSSNSFGSNADKEDSMHDATIPARALVMTSGNLSEEPIVSDNDDARERLSSLASAYLMHDRPIKSRIDDSVIMVTSTNSPREKSRWTATPIRRARGFAPDPILLPWTSQPLLATGGELKNTFCLSKGIYAFLSHHIGDLENYETLQSFEESITHYERLFKIIPEALAYDLHPDYLASRYAIERAHREGLPAVGIQHHHAHIAACMAEYGLSGNDPLIGVAFDGTGFGDDGSIWGGEFLVADYHQYMRAYHLAYVPLPGGERAIREPWRISLSWLMKSGVTWEEDLPPVQHAYQHSPSGDLLNILSYQIVNGTNAPLTSSVGRLFDAAASLAGIRQVVNYEAQAAIEFENVYDPQEKGYYSFELYENIIDAAPVIEAITKDLRTKAPIARISSRFHNGIAQLVHRICVAMRNEAGFSTVALSGGVWQNKILLSLTMGLLNRDHFNVLVHRKVPSNDGGLALGQAAIAHHWFTGSIVS